MGIALRCALIGFLWVAILGQGVFHAFALLTDGDSDGAHLYHGWLMVLGELSLYQDDMTGHRTPFAYWWIGLSQVLFGPSLLAGRFFSLLAGWAGIAVLWRTATVSLGPSVGSLTVALVASQSYLLAHFAVAAYHGLAFFWVALGTWFLVASCSSYRREAVVLCAWALFLTRPQFGLCVPLAGAWAFWTGWGRRWVVLGALVAPGAAFLAGYWPGVLKITAYMPGLAGWAFAHGWVAVPQGAELDWASRIGRAGVLILRSYKAWIGLGLLAWCLRPVGGPRMPQAARSVAWAVAALAVSQLVVVNQSWKAAVGYFPAFAGLLALPLAAAVSAVWDAGRWRQWTMAAGLGTALGIGLSASPPPNLPSPVPWSALPALEMRRAAAQVRELIPVGTTVFLFGPATAVHEAGLRPPIQPSNHLETLTNGPAVRPEGFAPGLYEAMARSGLWTTGDIVRWLGPDGYPWAIVWMDGLEARRVRYGWESEMAMIKVLLEHYYAPVGSVQYHGIGLGIWQRRHKPWTPRQPS